VTIRFQAAISDYISSFWLTGRRFDISTAILCQDFSMGLRSGDCAGQSMVVMLFGFIQATITFARWQGALSSWNKKEH